MKQAFVILSLTLAACATGADIYESGVDEMAVIEKPLAEVTQCMTLRMGSAPAVDTEGKTTFFVKDAYESTLALISLSAVPEGTLVEVRRRDSLVSSGMWKHCR